MSSQISTATGPAGLSLNAEQEDGALPERFVKPATDPSSTPGIINLNPIGRVRSCFAEKFGTPRQPTLAKAARGVIEIVPPYHQRQAWHGLDGFSHIWVVFWFHGQDRRKWQPSVRPPRLGGNRKIGVFATRSGFRPNPIGISAVKLEGIEFKKRLTRLHVSGLDLIEATPVMDIKPYLPWADQIPNAAGGFARSRPGAILKVSFADQALAELQRYAPGYPGLPELIRQVIELDPRPAYMQEQEGSRSFGMQLYDMEIKWKTTGDKAVVTSVCKLPPDNNSASSNRKAPGTDHD